MCVCVCVCVNWVYVCVKFMQAFVQLTHVAAAARDDHQGRCKLHRFSEKYNYRLR